MKISFYDPDDNKKPSTSKRTDESFTLDWVSELGWSDNPFTQHKHFIAGMEEERQEINLFFIKKLRFGTIKGPSGTGKTTLLNWLADALNPQKDFTVHRVDAAHIKDAAHLRVTLADKVRGFFGKGKALELNELFSLLQKKAGSHYVLLVDNAHELTKQEAKLVESLTELPASILCAGESVSAFSKEDELELTLGKRTAHEYELILKQRIESVGGEDIKPFTVSVVKHLAEESDDTREFLALAHETAIAIALKQITLEEETPPEQVAEEAEKKASSRTKKGVKGRKRTKYDDLIESLSEELTE